MSTNDIEQESQFNNETEKQMFNFDFVNNQQPLSCNLIRKTKTKIPKLNFNKTKSDQIEETDNAAKIEIVQLSNYNPKDICLNNNYYEDCSTNNLDNQNKLSNSLVMKISKN